MQWAMGAAHNPMSLMDPYKSGQIAAMMMSPSVDAVTKMNVLESMMNAFRLDQFFGPVALGVVGFVLVMALARIGKRFES